MYPKKELAQLVIAACNQFQIDTVVISPGSRNAPLTVGFTNHPSFRTMSIVDERCAAFYALGIAQQIRKPVAVVCTSGSALLNYYPAIAEAFYSNIPLVIISADRPKHLIDIGDGQTIRQENVYDNHILFSANLIEDASKTSCNVSLISNALHKATLNKGPVHINVPFDEPLYETIPQLDPVIANKVKQFVDEISLPPVSCKDKLVEGRLKNIWKNTTKKMILVGANYPDKSLQVLLSQFEKDPAVIILTETTSNIASGKTINAIDQLIFPLIEEQLEALKPEVLITFGGMIVSKKIKQFLRKHQPNHHWHIDTLKSIDTFHCLSEYIDKDPIAFLPKLTALPLTVSKYQQKWLSEKEKRAAKHQAYLSKAPFSDLKVFEHILETVQDNTQLQLANSSIIRYTQLFDLNNTVAVFCNRGTSGIDGSTSTAIGAALAQKNKTLFITGDLSFFYDSNALWNAYIPSNFRIIIINNSGGGIFRFIPGPKSTNALEYFETPHQLTAVHLCKMHQLAYSSANNVAELKERIADFYGDSELPKVLEVFTDKEVNEKVLKEYFNFLK